MFVAWVEECVYQTDKIWDVLKEEQIAFWDKFIFEGKKREEALKFLERVWLKWEETLTKVWTWEITLKQFNELFFEKLWES